jgi:hypothetical protein
VSKFTKARPESWREPFEKRQKYKLTDTLARLRQKKLGRVPVTHSKAGLRTRIRNLKRFYEFVRTYWEFDIPWDNELVEEFLYLNPRPNLVELSQVFHLPKSVISVDPQSKFRLRGYVPDPVKPGWLKYDEAGYVEFLKSEALRRQDMMRDIIKTRTKLK